MKRPLLIIISLLFISAGIYFYIQRNESRKPWETEGEKEKTQIKIIEGLATCPVCGYKAVEQDNKPCKNCNVIGTKAQADSHYLSYPDFLRMEQLDYFSRDTLNYEVNLFGPKVSALGYPKDENWKPQQYVNKGTVTEFLRIKVTALKELIKEKSNSDSILIP